MKEALEQLTAESRNLDSQEELIVKEMMQLKNLINAARLAPFRIEELKKKLTNVRNQQALVESQIAEVDMKLAMKGLLKTTNGGIK